MNANDALLEAEQCLLMHKNYAKVSNITIIAKNDAIAVAFCPIDSTDAIDAMIQCKKDSKMQDFITIDPYAKKLWPAHIRSRAIAYHVPAKLKRKDGNAIFYCGSIRVHNNFALSLAAEIASSLELTLVCKFQGGELESFQISTIFGLLPSRIVVEPWNVFSFEQLVQQVANHSNFSPHLMILEESYSISKVSQGVCKSLGFAVFAVDSNCLIPPYYADYEPGISLEQFKTILIKAFPPTIQALPTENYFSFAPIGILSQVESDSLDHLRQFLQVCYYQSSPFTHFSLFQSKTEQSLELVIQDVENGYLNPLLVLKESFSLRRQGQFADRQVWDKLINSLLVQREYAAVTRLSRTRS
jgi:hypothetical protein